MYTQDMLESIKKVEATREARIQAVLAGNHPRRMTAEEKDQVLLENHPDHIADQFTELTIGPNKGEKVPLELAELLNRKLRPKSQKEPFPIHVNLIPVNPVNETEFSASDKSATEKFAATLEQKGIRATIRRRLGADINASCGQLRRGENNT